MSSRVRLARNIDGYPFLAKAGEQEIARIEELLRNKILACELRQGLRYYRVDEMDPLMRQLLVERHLMSKDHAEAEWVRGIAFCPKEQFGLLVNEEDHLRIQVVYGGLQLEKAWHELSEADNAMAEVIPFSFSARGQSRGCS